MILIWDESVSNPPGLMELAPLAGGTLQRHPFFFLTLLHCFLCKSDSCVGLILVWG